MPNYTKVSSSYIVPISYSLILATDLRGGIGLNNDLPWKGIVDNKEDMQWFRDKTKGKIVVMGYNTWVSIGRKPLPGRTNIIITANHRDEVNRDIGAHIQTLITAEKNIPTVLVYGNPQIAVDGIKNGVGDFHLGGEVMVIGGAKIYEAFIQWTSRIYLTTFDYEFEADTFVNLNLDKWDLCYRDSLSLLKPKFEVWDCTEEAAKRADSDVMQISYEHKPAAGFVAEYYKEKEDKADV